MKKDTERDYAAALYQITEGISGKKLEERIKGFVGMLVRRRHLKKADRIVTEYIRYAKRQAGINEIAVTTARKLDAASLKRIKQAFGGQVEATETENPALLGGFTVRTADAIFDASVSTQLKKLREQLVK